MNKNRSFFCITLFLLLELAWGGIAVQAQDSNAYFLANQMLQSQNYERAYELFEKLHRQNPDNFLFLEKATESLINLKQYEQAIEITKEAKNRPYYPARAGIRLGEIYHISGDTAKAFDIWDEVRENNPDNMETYLSLARSMKDRKAFSRAIEIYKEASRLFSDASVLSGELANTYMQAGQYEASVREYLNLIKENPDRINYVQSTLLRFDDDYLYDIAILEIGDFLEELPSDHPAHRDLHQLELWLLLERELYERALATAKKYEESQSRVTFSLYSLGSKLFSDRQYELAEQAFRYYVDNDIGTAKYQSLEEIGAIYTEWANYLSDFNLSSAGKRDSLYRKAYQTLSVLEDEVPNYRNLDRVLIKQAELSLDYLHRPENAEQYLTKLEQRADSSNLAQRNYIQGRIYLYEKNYSRARIAFTKSTKQERLGELAEKSRYYLALTDFYAGDYEFAKIQLNALERQTTSYFANDAVQLRVWIQDGLQADSTGAMLEPFAKAIELFSKDEAGDAIKKLEPILAGSAFNPLSDEALLELSSHLTRQILPQTYALITRYLTAGGRYSPLRERLMWEKARIADQVITNKNLSSLAENSVPESDDKTTEEQFFKGISGEDTNISLPSDAGQVITLYEEILLEYPQGFYASFARSRIEELQNIET